MSGRISVRFSFTLLDKVWYNRITQKSSYMKKTIFILYNFTYLHLYRIGYNKSKKSEKTIKNKGGWHDDRNSSENEQ